MDYLEHSGTTETEEDGLDLHWLWLALKHHWLPAVLVFGSVVAIAAFNTFNKVPSYKATGKLLFRSSQGSFPLQEISEKFGGLASVVGNSNRSSLTTEAEVIQSAPVTQKTINALNLKDDQGQPLTVEALRGGLVVEPVEGTDILQVTYETKDPQQAAAIVNQLMDSYLDINVRNDKVSAVSLRTFLEKQIPTAKTNIYQAETTLRQFKEKNQIVVPEEEATLAVTNLADLEKQRNEAQTQLLAAQAQSAELRSKLGMNSQQALTTNSLSQAPGVQKAQENLQEIETELAKQRATYQDTHPVIQDLKDKQAELKAVLAKQVGSLIGTSKPVASKKLQAGETRQQLAANLVTSEVERLGLISQVASLTNLQKSYQQRMGVLPQLEQTFRDLEREREIAQETYKALAEKLEVARVQEAKVLAENQATVENRILEKAKVPVAPLTTNKLINLMIGGLLGGILAVALAFFLELIDSSIKTAKEAKEKLGYAVLGTIPALETTGNSTQRAYLEPAAAALPTRDAPRSMASEAYRKLQVNLQFLKGDRPVKVMVVTSAVPKEGKSTVSANLAMTMAQRGYRVLLVDVDVRCPTQDQIWHLPNSVGLSNFVAGEVTLGAAVQRVAENLDVLTSGPLPPNPGDVLDSQRLGALMEVSSLYDCVILDTAPLVVAADALIMGKLADGVLVVVQPGVVKSVSATSAKESLEQSGQNVLGMVINGVEPEKEYTQYYSDDYSQQGDKPNRKMSQKLVSGIKQITKKSP